MDNKDPKPKQKDNSSSKNSKIIIQSAVAVVVVLLAFWFGIQFGNGNIGALYAGHKNLANSLNYSELQQEYQLIKQNYDGSLTTSQLQDGVMSGLAASTGDPYTEYFNSSQAQDLNNELNNVISGIGVELGENSQNQIVVIAPISGTPAAKAGLQPNDVISSVNGASTMGANIDNVVDSIRGKAGTSVTLGVQRGTSQLTFKITRQTLTIPSVQSSIINGNIGYIQIIDFANDTGSLAQQAANNFKQKNVKGVILDLRNDPGGLVTAAVDVSSLWLPSGKTIMIEKHNNQVVQTYYSSGNDTLNGIPTVVLINGGSASASEITAGALKDNNVATLIGQKSFGKGSVQDIYNLAGGAEVKVTIAHWYTPDNINISKVGITPDTVVNQGSSSATDEQKSSAISYLENH